MKDLIREKSNTRMDGHLKDVKITQWKLFNIIKGITSKVEPVPEKTFTISSSEKLLPKIEQNFEEVEKKRSKTLRQSNSKLRKSFLVSEDKLYKDLTSDQRCAGDYLLNKIHTLGDVDQLLMLHG